MRSLLLLLLLPLVIHGLTRSDTIKLAHNGSPNIFGGTVSSQSYYGAMYAPWDSPMDHYFFSPGDGRPVISVEGMSKFNAL
jgi:hypothetical protein